MRLRPWRYDDAGLVLAVADDPLNPLVTTVPRDGRSASAAAYVERQHRRLEEGTGFSFVVADLETDRPMGSIGLWTGEIAWGGRPPATGWDPSSGAADTSPQPSAS